MKVKAEYTDLRVKMNKEKKDEEKKAKKSEKKEFMNSLIPSLKGDGLECNNCDVKVESVSSKLPQTEETVQKDKCVQVSVQEFSEDKTVQTLDPKAPVVTSKHPCFYCSKNIVSENHLNEHKVRCRGTANMFCQPGLPPPPVPRFSFSSSCPSRLPPPHSGFHSAVGEHNTSPFLRKLLNMDYKCTYEHRRRRRLIMIDLLIYE